MIRRLFARREHAKPRYNDLYPDTYVVYEFNAFENLIDDWRRYGWETAWANFKFLLRDED